MENVRIVTTESKYVVICCFIGAKILKKKHRSKYIGAFLKFLVNNKNLTYNGNNESLWHELEHPLHVQETLLYRLGYLKMMESVPAKNIAMG